MPTDSPRSTPRISRSLTSARLSRVAGAAEHHVAEQVAEAEPVGRVVAVTAGSQQRERGRLGGGHRLGQQHEAVGELVRLNRPMLDLTRARVTR